MEGRGSGQREERCPAALLWSVLSGSRTGLKLNRDKGAVCVGRAVALARGVEAVVVMLRQ